MADSGATTNYDEIQENELEAMRAIFVKDFEEKQSKGAWNKKAAREFNLTLRPLNEAEAEDVFVTLHITLPATYPKTIPNCRIIRQGRMPGKCESAIAAILKKKPKELLGSEMIYEIASSISEILEDAVTSLAVTHDQPTLEQERATQEAEVQRKAEAERLQQEQQQKKFDDEEERLLAEMVRKERSRVARLQEKQHQQNDVEAPDTEGGDLTFDQTIKFANPAKDDIIVFRSIVKKSFYRKGPVTAVIAAEPVQQSHSSEPDEPSPAMVAVKTCILRSEKRLIQNLESKLQSLVDLSSHPSVLRTLGFRILKEPEKQSDWSINILVPFAHGRSFRDLLQTIKRIDVVDLRPWLIQILEGLQFLHHHRVVLGRLNVDNILLDTNDTGFTIAKISDAGFQYDLHVLHHGGSTRFASAASSDWMPPESGGKVDSKPQPAQDIWDFGVFLLQSLFGLEVQRQYNSPTGLIEELDLSISLSNLLQSLFRADYKKRPGAFELLPNEFLRNDDPAVIQNQPQQLVDSVAESSLLSIRPSRGRRESTYTSSQASRYAKDFVELGRLGRGGFGEVVRARNKLDGTTYAIKKISQPSASALDGILSEVMLLSRLNHPFIVRYYAVWQEESGYGLRASSTKSSQSDNEGSIAELPSSNTRGLDFISSGGAYPNIEFAYGSEDEDSDEAVGSDTESSTNGRPESSSLPALQRRRSSASAASKVTLYIQMEYCEKQTLRGLFQDLPTNTQECWRLFRQILDCLAYIHANGILHRDLKPDNIFVTTDEMNQARIKVGDFGLARLGESSSRAKHTGSVDPQLTASIGTSLYVAPEVRSSGGGSYNDKADMYSLGIILFEMSYRLSTAMERVRTLEDLRDRNFTFPPAFQEPDKQVQADVIKLLIRPRPSERPSSQDLLRSGKIPSHMEDETIKAALESLSNKSSPLFNKLVEQLFLQMGKGTDTTTFTYDLDLNIISQGSDILLLKSLLRSRLTDIFTHHGAVEIQRQRMIPASQYYDSAVRLIDSSGTLLQLPYDLTLPYARSVATQTDVIGKTFSFGEVFRVAPAGKHPKAHGELDFDIITNDALDLALREAETVKVIDEIMDAVPSMAALSIAYYVTHSKLIDAILVYCGVTVSPAVKQVISKLNVGQWTWSKIRNELRTPAIGVASTSLDDLMRFDFREPCDVAITRLRSLLEDCTEDLESTFRHLQAMTAYLERFRIKRKVFISPLSSVNEQFYRGNIMFQCIHDTKRKKVICAGGRYDALIQENRTGPKLNRHGVGFNLAWDTLVESMIQILNPSGKQFLKKAEAESLRSQWKARRCDVLVDSSDAAVLRSSGIDIVQELWANDISAELVVDSSIRESLSHQNISKPEQAGYGWLVFIKQDETLKIRTVARREDVELRRSELVNWLRMDIAARDRDIGTEAASSSGASRALTQHMSHDGSSGAGIGTGDSRNADVQVLVAQHRSKKTNRRNIVDDALIRTAALNASFLAAPIAAVELKDDIFDALRETRLSDPETWRRFIQAAPLSERQYLGQVHSLLTDHAADEANAAGAIWLYNFRSRSCFLYDLGKEAAR